MDATYRADLSQFNELNFARFEARLDALETELNARMDVMQSGILVQLEKRMNEQTRFYFLAWAILLASNIALWFR